jgi:hypothetical protein
MTLRRPALLALTALVLLAACSNNPVLPTQVGAAGLQITVDPSPIVATENPVTLVNSASYKITMTETNGLGGQLVSVTGAVYNPASGRLVSLNYFDSADLIVFVGKDRLEPNGTISFTQTASYSIDENGDGVTDPVKAALLTVSAQMKDDKGNLINASTLVNIQ